MTRFTDSRSKAQIAQYRLHELHAARWRNAKNLERWNDGCRDRWELSQLKSPRLIVEEDTFVRTIVLSEGEVAQ